MVETVDEVPSVDSNPQLVVVDNRMYLATNRYTKAHNSLHLGLENLSPDYMAHILPKKSPLLRPFNML